MLKISLCNYKDNAEIERSLVCKPSQSKRQLGILNKYMEWPDSL